jgi:hypothetical protein
MQLHFVSDMYQYPYLYGTTGLQTSYQTLIGAMLNSDYVITTPEKDQLSLWSLVMDIQGGFIKGKKNKGKEGVRFLFGEEEDDPYAGTFGTSATLMHYGFGWGGKQEVFESSRLKHGELAHHYPYIAEAVHNRGLKREAESFGPGPFKSYKHTDLDKSAIKEKAQITVKSFSDYTPVHWDVRPQRIKDDVGSVRKDVLL